MGTSLSAFESETDHPKWDNISISQCGARTDEGDTCEVPVTINGDGRPLHCLQHTTSGEIFGQQATTDFSGVNKKTNQMDWSDMLSRCGAHIDYGVVCDNFVAMRNNGVPLRTRCLLHARSTGNIQISHKNAEIPRLRPD